MKVEFQSKHILLTVNLGFQIILQLHFYHSKQVSDWKSYTSSNYQEFKMTTVNKSYKEQLERVKKNT